MRSVLYDNGCGSGEKMDQPVDIYAVGDRVPPPYFFGVLPEGLEKRAFDDPFNTQGWLDHCRQAANKLGIRQGRALGSVRASRRTLALTNAFACLRSPALAARLLTAGTACPGHLLPVAAMIQDIYLRQKRVSVLDVGGGFGDNFFELLRVMPRGALEGLKYDVVDNEPSCRLGQQLFAGYEVAPRFTSDHTSLTGTYDIVMLVGTLQYIDRWREVLPAIAARSSRYLYIARSPIGAGSSFTSTQLICPAYGAHAGRNLGSTPINVIGLDDLRSVAGRAPWRPMLELADLDYSSQFARLAAPWSSVSYYLLAWHRE